MQSIKVANRILLCSVASSVSFLLGLLINRDLPKALLTAGITAPAAYVGSAIADRRRIYQEKLLKSSLQLQIQELEEEETQLYHSLAAATATRQEIEASINALQSERSLLLNRVSELHIQRNELYRDLSDFQKQKQEEEVGFYALQTQLQQLEKQQAEINQSLSGKTFQLQKTETRLNRLKNELEHLQDQISEQQKQQEQLHPNLALLERRKQNLEGEAYDLQTQIQVLQQRQDQLKQALAPLQEQQQEVEASLLAGKVKLDQLIGQIAEKRKQQKKLSKELANLENRKQQLEVASDNLQTQIQEIDTQENVTSQTITQGFENVVSIFLPEEWREWLGFIQQLNDDEQRAFKAILEKDAATLKRIADKQSTMPEVLIESINEIALNTFGDTLLVSGGASVIPEIHEDYSYIFKEPIILYFKDLLNYKNILSQTNTLAAEIPGNSSASIESKD
ncbi:MAG: tellurite resistance TerB C-terminal domain-containing protein [Cyanobacteriota bacterium]